MSVYVSVIIPLYNSEKYLNDAIDSILSQTFTNFEIICVNDASTDSTLSIIKEYECKDKRVKIVNNDLRMGAAASRNRGISHAMGKYVVFLDGDDVFDEFLLEKSVKAADMHKADTVFFEIMHVPSQEIKDKKQRDRNIKYYQKFANNPFSIEECNPVEAVFFPTSTSCKMLNKDFLLKNDIHFQTIESSNDVCFSFMTLLLSDRMIVLNDRNVMVYARDHYEVNRISNYRDPFCSYYALLKLKEQLIKRNLFRKYKEYFNVISCTVIINAVRRCGKEDDKELFLDFISKNGIKELLYPERVTDRKDALEGYILNVVSDKQMINSFSLLSLLLHCSQSISKLRTFFTEKQENNKPVAIWGAGKNGQTIINAMEEIGIQAEYLIDSDNNKLGMSYKGYPIYTPDSVKDKVGAVIISSQSIKEEDVINCFRDTIEIAYIWDVLGVVWN